MCLRRLVLSVTDKQYRQKLVFLEIMPIVRNFKTVAAKSVQLGRTVAVGFELMATCAVVYPASSTMQPMQIKFNFSDRLRLRLH